jgi:hypothetical protein
MTGVSVVANPSFTPPRMEVTCTVVPGDVMKTATLNRIVNGVSTPTLSQPAPGFDTQVVEDYLAPYGVPVSYEFITDYTNPAGTTVWDETWANLSNWTGATGNFSVSGGVASAGDTSSSAYSISRSIPTPSLCRVTVGKLTSLNQATAVRSGLFLLNGATVIAQIASDGLGHVQVIRGGSAVATGISGNAPFTIDMLGSTIVIQGSLAGSYSWVSSAVLSSIQLTAASPGTTSFGEIKVASYSAATHLDVTSASATLSPSQAWMVHPGSPSLSVPISSSDRSAIAVRNLGPISQASASTLHPILGQSLPIATRSGPRFGNTLQVALKARTAAHEAALNGILADGTPLLFRFPPTYDAGFDEGFYSVGNVQRARMAQLKGNHLREFTLDLTQVQQPTLTVQNTGWSWAALAAAFPTWQAVAAAYNTWADVLTNNRKPGY